MTADRQTIEVYDELAASYEANRPPRFADRATAFAAPLDGIVADLGCGTGAYLAALGLRTIGFDASNSMLALAAPAGRPLVRADLAMLPVRPGSLAGGWARNSYLHVPHGDLPLALAELHRALPVGAPLTLSFIPGPDDRLVSDDDLPGRNFWRWSDEHLVDVLAGAGFESIEFDGLQPRFAAATRTRTLPDTVAPDMRLLVCGLNPSIHAADAGVGFVTPGNRFWPAALATGLCSLDRDPWDAIRTHGVGMTDLVKRATRRADELDPAEYVAGVQRVARLCERLAPEAVCMVGLAGWRAAVDRRAVAGWQPRPLGGRPVYVMPSTSGLNAHSRLDDLADHLRAALDGPGEVS